MVSKRPVRATTIAFFQCPGIGWWGQWLRVCIQDSNPANVLITMTFRSLDHTSSVVFYKNIKVISVVCQWISVVYQ